jgi:putative endonuclease
MKERLYIGHTSVLDKRLKLHNEGHSISTKAFILWEIIYFEEFETKSEAMKREYALKRIKNKQTIYKIVIEKK